VAAGGPGSTDGAGDGTTLCLNERVCLPGGAFKLGRGSAGGGTVWFRTWIGSSGTFEGVRIAALPVGISLVEFRAEVWDGPNFSELKEP